METGNEAPENHIIINTADTKSILEFDPNGNAKWIRYNDDASIKEVIEITDNKLLMLAFMDTVMQLSCVDYNYELLDKELYKEYKKFIESGQESGEDGK